jgi:hypothetical protein
MNAACDELSDPDRRPALDLRLEAEGMLKRRRARRATRAREERAIACLVRIAAFFGIELPHLSRA